jgi:hypothetical protein
LNFPTVSSTNILDCNCRHQFLTQIGLEKDDACLYSAQHCGQTHAHVCLATCNGNYLHLQQNVHMVQDNYGTVAQKAKGPRNLRQTSHKFHVLTRDCVCVTRFLCEGEAAAQGLYSQLRCAEGPEHPMAGSYSRWADNSETWPRALCQLCRDSLTSCSPVS